MSIDIQREMFEKYAVGHAQFLNLNWLEGEKQYSNLATHEAFTFFRRGQEARQAEQEPVAWHVGNIDGTMNKLGAIYQRESNAVEHIKSYEGELEAKVIPLYTSPISNSDAVDAKRYRIARCFGIMQETGTNGTIVRMMDDADRLVDKAMLDAAP